MEEDTSVTDNFIITMRFECLRLASCNSNREISSNDVVKEATILFNFLIGDTPEETQERTN